MVEEKKEQDTRLRELTLRVLIDLSKRISPLTRSSNKRLRLQAITVYVKIMMLIYELCERPGEDTLHEQPYTSRNPLARRVRIE